MTVHRHVLAIEDRTWMPSADTTGPAHLLLRLACVTYDGTPMDPSGALAILREHPGLPASELAVAVVSGEVDAVRALIPDGVPSDCGPFGWSALMYLTYGRKDVPVERTLAVARLLLAAGDDPNDGRYVNDLPTPFTVLTGVFGGGENGESAHPHATLLARVLLAAGADPNDTQTLYNRMFDVDDGFVDVPFDHGLGQGDGGPWRRRMPDLADSPAEMLGSLLAWAVTHDQRDRVALLARHGVDVLAPLPRGPLHSGGTPLAVALRNGHRELADLLRGLGASDSDLDPVETFVGAVLAGDVEAVAATAPDVVGAARTARPALVVWAATHGGAAAVDLAVAHGFDVNALGRADAPVEQPWQTALHTAVDRDDVELARHLLGLGADPTVRDRRFDGTPLDWARHLDRPRLVELLG